MGNKNNKDTSETPKSNDKQKRLGSKLEFTLVIVMLGLLTSLVVLLLLLPVIYEGDNIDYYKWVLTSILGTFGAWIGAGAAYFFGKENLRMSSDSTQKALESTMGLAKGRRIELALVNDLNPTPLNQFFTFSLEAEVEEVFKKLKEIVDYWFVPIIEYDKIEDTIHTEAFWRYRQDKNWEKSGEIKDVINYIGDTKEMERKKKRLHGFFLEVTMDDFVTDVSKKMEAKEATVGIVCDSDGKPTHCFSIGDLKSYMLGCK